MLIVKSSLIFFLKINAWSVFYLLIVACDSFKNFLTFFKAFLA